MLDNPFLRDCAACKKTKHVDEFDLVNRFASKKNPAAARQPACIRCIATGKYVAVTTKVSRRRFTRRFGKLRVEDHERRVKRSNDRAAKLGKIGRLRLEEWLKIVRHYEETCAWCGDKERGYEMDHVRALAYGGEHVPHNIQLLCRKCNLKKGRSFADFRKDQGAWANKTFGLPEEGAEYAPIDLTED